MRSMLRWLSRAIVAAAALFAGLYAARPITTWDFWWHVAAGEEILRTRSLPATDSFSHTAGSLPWVNHEWLFDVIVQPIWASRGGWPIRLACGIVAAATILLVARMARQWTDSRTLAAVITAAFLALYFGNIQVRPQILSYPLFLLFFDWFCFRADPPGPPRAPLLITASALMIFWANIHAVALLPLIFYAAYLAADAASRALAGRVPFLAAPPPMRLPWRAHVAPFLILLGCTFLNANTWRLHEYALEGSSFASTFVNEWAPFYFDYASNRNLPIAIYLTVIASMVLCAAALAAHLWLSERLDLAQAVVIALSLYFVITGRRWLWMAVLPAMITLASGSPLRRLAAGEPAATPSRRKDRTIAKHPGSGAWRPAGALVMTLAITAALAEPLAEFRPVRQAIDTLRAGTYHKMDVNPELIPGAAVEVMSDAGLAGNLFNYYGWGGYLIYKLHPRCLDFVDGRAVLFGPQVIADALAIQNLKPEASSLLDRYRVDLTVMPAEWRPPAPAATAAAAPWILYFRNDASAVHGRAGENLTRISAYYEARKIPFDPAAGFLEGPAIEADKEWARAHRVVSDDVMAVVDPLYEVLRTGRWRISGSPAPFRMRLAETLMKAGYPASAARELRLALEADPANRFATLNLASVEIGLGHGASARSLLQEYLGRNPGDGEAAGLFTRARQMP